MNNVELIGNLVRDPEMRYVGQNNTAMTRFTIAVNDGYGDKQRTSFIPIVVFNKKGENCNQYLSKGSKVAVTGRLQTGSYQNKEGATVYTTDVIANDVEFLSTRGGNGSQSQPQPQQNNAQPAPPPMDDGFQEMADDDIPF